MTLVNNVFRSSLSFLSHMITVVFETYKLSSIQQFAVTTVTIKALNKETLLLYCIHWVTLSVLWLVKSTVNILIHTHATVVTEITQWI